MILWPWVVHNAQMFEREKTLEALAFFQSRVRKAGHLKLLKLLFYLDLLHFRQTGRSVTGLDYEAWPMGPVPRSLWEEIKTPGSALSEHFEVTGSEAIEEPAQVDAEGGIRDAYTRHVPGQLIPKRPYQHLYLSRREHKLAEELAEIFANSDAAEMSEVSHNQAGPWRVALQKGGHATPVNMLEGEVGLGRPDMMAPPQELAERVAEYLEVKELLR